MPFFALSILLQVALVVHIVKTGRSTTWIWIVVMLPMAGSLAYLILEVLPELSNSKAGRSASRKVTSVINPNRDINAAVQQFSITGTVENSKRLAEECFNKGLYSEAKELYVKCLSGAFSDDAHLMFGLAKTDFHLCNYADVKATLDKLIELHPDYKNQEAHLLYARSLEGLNESTKAQHEYETLHEYYVGPQASFYYAKFLQSQSQSEKAKAIFQEILNTAKFSGKHYNEIHKNIIKQAKVEVGS